jgi:DNA-binding ferritin-like protein (Dps family)
MFKKIIETVTGSLDAKKEYRLYKKRIDKLPTEYKNTMLGIQTYMQNFGSLDGKELYDILDMLEIAAADGRKVTDIIGKDIGSFCEEVIQANPEKTWINGYKEKITKRINKRIDKKAK